jgi:hypothetical protein
MLFNFKNINIKIILLILLVLASVACYSMMRRDLEGLTNISSHFEKNFKIYTRDLKNGIDYYFLEPYSSNETDINFTTDIPLSSLNATLVSKEDVNTNGGIYKYMFKNGYDMYRLTKTNTGVESYEVYNIDIPFSINLLGADSATTASTTTASPTTASPTTASTTTASPTTASPTTASATTASLTTASPTTASLTTASPTTASATTASPTTASPTTASPTTVSPTTVSPTTVSPTTASLTTASPTTASPTTASPTTASPTTGSATTGSATTASQNEGFGNMFSYLFGKKVKEGNTGMDALTYKGNILFGVKEGDYSKVLRKSRETMDITIKKSNNLLVQNGGLLVKPQNYVGPPPTETSNNNTDGGDGNYSSYNSCLIPGSDPALVTNNKSPFYPDTSMFETAMQNPSNPIVNPVNSLNPIQYSQTLFSPSVQPVMANTACSSSENNEVPTVTDTATATATDTATATATATVAPLVGDVNNINAPNVPNNIFNDINNMGERMLAQNGNSNIDTNTKFSELQGANNMNVSSGFGGGSVERTNNKFPEYNPNINDGNNQVPRPVLANFSTFGS